MLYLTCIIFDNPLILLGLLYTSLLLSGELIRISSIHNWIELLPLQQTSNLCHVDQTLPNVIRDTPCSVIVMYDDHSLNNF